ncbi:MAG: hypothetical protein ACUVQG_04585 [Thermogutta sp.]
MKNTDEVGFQFGWQIMGNLAPEQVEQMRDFWAVSTGGQQSPRTCG